MEKEKLIYADSAKMVVEYFEQHLVTSDSEFIQGYLAGIKEMANGLAKMPPVDAAPVVRGWWKEYSHSALVNWKNGEPVWADRTVYRCSGCDFGTIIKHNYCPRCGANMMDYERSPHE